MISQQNSLPIDIALKIALSLKVSDVCSLGCCSRFWRELSGSDCVWEALCRERWPAISLDRDSASRESQSQQFNQHSDPNDMGWREIYVSKHNEMAEKAAFIFNFVERCLAFDSIQIRYHLKAVEYLYSMQFGFKDIQMLFLRPDVNVLLNLIGLHYCIIRLEVPAESMNLSQKH